MIGRRLADLNAVLVQEVGSRGKIPTGSLGTADLRSATITPLPRHFLGSV